MTIILNAAKFGGRYGNRYGYRYGYHYGYRYGYHRGYFEDYDDEEESTTSKNILEPIFNKIGVKGIISFLIAIIGIIIAIIGFKAFVNKDKVTSPEKQPQTEVVAEPKPSEYYSIVMACFSTNANAELCTKQFSDKGLKGCHVANSGTIYRVLYSRFTTKEEAQAKLNTLRATNLLFKESWVHKISGK